MTEYLDYEPMRDPETGREIIPNPERGCGYLEAGKSYVRTDPVRGGDIPIWVSFDPPIPYKEGTLRSYDRIDGISLQLSVSHKHPTKPRDDIDDLLSRVQYSEDGDHYGEMTTGNSQDIMMWVGETYYETPPEFIDEARRFGVNKAIPVSRKQSPPTINPGKTRLFCIHPTAYKVYKGETGEVVRLSYQEYIDMDEDEVGEAVETVPGIIGYSYLSRVIRTAPQDGDVPKWVKDYNASGKLDVVDVGEPISSEEIDERLRETDGDPTTQEVREKLHDMICEVSDVLTPGHGEGEGEFVERVDRGYIETMSYNKLKRKANRLDLDVSAQPTKEELITDIGEAVQNHVSRHGAVPECFDVDVLRGDKHGDVEGGGVS